MSEHDNGYKLVISVKKLRYGRLLTMKGCGCAIGQIIDQLTPRGHKLWVRRKLGEAGYLAHHHIHSLRYVVPELGTKLLEAGIIVRAPGEYWEETDATSSVYRQSDYVVADLKDSGRASTRALKETLRQLDLEVEIVE